MSDVEAVATDKSSATPKAKRDRGEKKPNIFARMALFFRQVISELRKVVWPTRNELVTYTAVVLVFVLIIMAYVSGLDYLFGKGVFWLFSNPGEDIPGADVGP